MRIGYCKLNDFYTVVFCSGDQDVCLLEESEQSLHLCFAPAVLHSFHIPVSMYLEI